MFILVAYFIYTYSFVNITRCTDHCSNVPNTFIINQLGTRDLFNRSWENNLLLFILQSK